MKNISNYSAVFFLPVAIKSTHPLHFNIKMVRGKKNATGNLFKNVMGNCQGHFIFLKLVTGTPENASGSILLKCV